MHDRRPFASADDDSLRRLYPQLTEADRRSAADTLWRYVEISLRIYERLLSDPEAYARFKALTQSSDQSTLKE